MVPHRLDKQHTRVGPGCVLYTRSHRQYLEQMRAPAAESSRNSRRGRRPHSHESLEWRYNCGAVVCTAGALTLELRARAVLADCRR